MHDFAHERLHPPKFIENSHRYQKIYHIFQSFSFMQKHHSLVSIPSLNFWNLTTLFIGDSKTGNGLPSLPTCQPLPSPPVFCYSRGPTGPKFARINTGATFFGQKNLRKVQGGPRRIAFKWGEKNE